jgi:hypothetical protein
MLAWRITSVLAVPGELVRAGRAVLGWTMKDLGNAARCSGVTIKNIEDKAYYRRAGRTSVQGRVIEALNAAGVRFYTATARSGLSIGLASA